MSGRALAASARRAGFVPLVADFFADADTGQIAHSCYKLDDLKGGFRWKVLAPALGALAEAAPSPLLGVVYGSGFEDRPTLLAKIAERWPLLGNGPSVVERVKSPEVLFTELTRLGIPHPRTVMAFDRSLKARCLNPGTSADLTVATLFAASLQALEIGC